MGMASLQVVLESLVRLVAGFENEKKIQAPVVTATTLGMLLVTIGVKIGLYIMCNRLAKTSDSMNALAQDHKNDIMSNAVALVAAFLASRHKQVWFLDPVGAIGISIFIVLNWIDMAREQTDKLVGRAAEEEFVQKVEEIAKVHDVRMSVDIIRAFYFGHRYLVEIEVVMPDYTTLRVAHDTALELQQKIEQLPEVERCHVHVDYDFRTENEHKANFEKDNSGTIVGDQVEEV
jgi:cation diffusion facilitator family transporter